MTKVRRSLLIVFLQCGLRPSGDVLGLLELYFASGRGQASEVPQLAAFTDSPIRKLQCIIFRAYLSNY